MAERHEQKMVGEASAKKSATWEGRTMCIPSEQPPPLRSKADSEHRTAVPRQSEVDET